ncbi:DUF2947 family protein [Ferrimonas pelagia]|uniref:DUF2947 family protein n=1 Tax=Ferrimonas pelagia TaxID=1177826 RepID=A0ABP9EC45_9GAMM
MKHTDLSQYAFNWVFNRADMAISDQDKAAILPLHPTYAKQIWLQNVSSEAVDLDRLEDKDWLSQAELWPFDQRWDDAFESDDVALPADIAGYLNWDPKTIVYVCYDQGHIIETRYDVFKRSWKAFLFAEEQALVIGRRRNEALWFIDETTVKLGKKA